MLLEVPREELHYLVELLLIFLLRVVVGIVMPVMGFQIVIIV